MNSTADKLPDLDLAAKQAVRAVTEVRAITRFYSILHPLDPGEETEVLFIGRVSGERQSEPLTAWLTDAPPGYSPDVRITRGW
jgi:hypothetical protein